MNMDTSSCAFSFDNTLEELYIKMKSEYDKLRKENGKTYLNLFENNMVENKVNSTDLSLNIWIDSGTETTDDLALTYYIVKDELLSPLLINRNYDICEQDYLEINKNIFSLVDDIDNILSRNRNINEQILLLYRYYEIDDFLEIKHFLYRDISLIYWLSEIYKTLVEYFISSEFKLEILYDPELENHSELAIIIVSDTNSDDTIDKFLDEYWLDVSEKFNYNISIYERFK